MKANQRTGHDANGQWRTGIAQREPAVTTKDPGRGWSIEVKERKPSFKKPVRIAGCSNY